MVSKTKITALILCGGRGSRLGGKDKGLINFRGQPLVNNIIQRVQPQVGQIYLNANRNIDHYQKYGFQVLQDGDFRGEGPLAGILSGLINCNTDFLAVLPCDSPFIPSDLIRRLSEPFELGNYLLTIAQDGNQLQPAFSLLRKENLNSLRQFLESGERKLGQWLQSLPHALVDFSDQEQAFINLNEEEDFRRLVDD